MEIKTLKPETAKYLHGLGYLKTSWSYPYWDSIKDGAKDAISFWKHSKKYIFNKEQRKKLALLTIAQQSFTGIHNYP